MNVFHLEMDHQSGNGLLRRAGSFSVWMVATLFLAGCADSKPSQSFIEEGTGIELVFVEGFSFMMGSPQSELGREDQEIQHSVHLTRDYFLGRTEVTQAQWEAVMGDRPSRFDHCGPDCPVENISFFEIQEFLDRLATLSGHPFRLPTEAEWEYACRAGATTAFANGDSLSTDEANYDGDPAMPGWPKGVDRGVTLPVASFPSNAWGFFDLHGNVWEWTADEHCPYPDHEVTNPLAACGSDLKVSRGGSWHFGPDSARCALRYTHRPQDIGPSLGFRVALDAEGVDR